ncbi:MULTISPECIES: hypothetical protein [Bacillus]|uniref:Uncharacterized protein n=1 Tax=Bacillus glycinifermentans TaxID=1664069 RepID=A0A0T6BIC6_9BACI|nr:MULTISPECIES: hypothetical protein [Bacillus]KRT87058.1 hypothetical protein AB447_208815 [Bacillus glycinifermentans]MEC0341888.1 hypothetical protein [Bacillus sonorensis]MEC0457426.1 hypothetical protein [Bacillus sonorensis]MEC0487109.1 hypothetical protein [Bacillus glycinifermentans]MEC0530779.1 hypothetical protein [Bacillus sonorensis]
MILEKPIPKGILWDAYQYTCLGIPKEMVDLSKQPYEILRGLLHGSKFSDLFNMKYKNSNDYYSNRRIIGYVIRDVKTNNLYGLTTTETVKLMAKDGRSFDQIINARLKKMVKKQGEVILRPTHIFGNKSFRTRGFADTLIDNHLRMHEDLEYSSDLKEMALATIDNVTKAYLIKGGK